MVRIEFWLSISRFGDQLGISFDEMTNCRLLDRFESRHAKEVLAEFGRGYGRLPDEEQERTPEHEAFLQDAVLKKLADKFSRVSPVQLAVFAQMLAKKEWVPENLPRGGFEDIGVMFIEWVFGEGTPHDVLRSDREAGRRVCAELLPDEGDDIKGRARSKGDLRRVAKYEQDAARFDRLLKALMSKEVRLIMPVDPVRLHDEDEDSAQAEGDSSESAPSGDETVERHYQLTHDYLVPSLRTWIERELKQTLNGRAVPALREAARLYRGSHSHDTRFLPTPIQYLAIRSLTRHEDWMWRPSAR